MKPDRTITLLSNASATGAPQACQFSGRYCFAVNGTFGGASVALELLGPDGSNWVQVEDDSGALALTSARAVLVYLPAGSYRAAVTGGSGVALYADLRTVID